MGSMLGLLHSRQSRYTRASIPQIKTQDEGAAMVNENDPVRSKASANKTSAKLWPRTRFISNVCEAVNFNR